MTKSNRMSAALYAAVCMACASLPALGSAPATVDVPPGPLTAALKQLAEQSGVELAYSTEQLAGMTTRGVSGTLTAEAAVRKLLEGTGLEVTVHDSGAIIIAVPNKISAAIDEVIVTGTTIDDPIQSSRTGETLRERPQSVTIVTRERLDEQNLNSVAAALEQTTGITVTQVSNSNHEFYSRGFSIRSIQIDGGSPLTFNNFGFNQLPDLAIYEQVEVLRGADALFAGNGEPGGTIQLVRKRPTDVAKIGLALSAGRWDTFRAEVDASAPLAFDGRLRGRAVFLDEDAGSFRNIQDTTRSLIYAVLEADVTSTTQLSVGGTYDKRSTPHGGFGLPRYADGRDAHLPRSATLSADWVRTEAKSTDWFVRVDQKLGERWSLRANAARMRQSFDASSFYAYGSINPDTRLIDDMFGSRDWAEPVQNLADITLKGTFDLFGRTHRIAIGADWQDVDSGSNVWSNGYIADVNPFTFDPMAYRTPARGRVPEMVSNWDQKQNGIYVSLSLQLTDPLRMVGGARYSNYKYTYGYQFLTAAGVPWSTYRESYRDRDVVTPYVGFTYELGRDWTTYASYGESFESQANVRSGPFIGGSALEPKTGESMELGIKGGLWDGRAATQAAVYFIRRENEAVLDDSFPPQNTGGMRCCYLAQGVVESRGVDLEINGSLTRSWTMFAGYTYNQNEYKDGYTSDVGAAYMPITPKHLFKVWTTYDLSDFVPRLKVSGGVNLQSSTYVSGTVVSYDPITGVATGTQPYRFIQGGYTLLNARVEYGFNDNWSVALNLDNLLDKTYYQTVGTTAWGNWYGIPRNYMLSVRAHW